MTGSVSSTSSVLAAPAAPLIRNEIPSLAQLARKSINLYSDKLDQKELTGIILLNRSCEVNDVFRRFYKVLKRCFEQACGIPGSILSNLIKQELKNLKPDLSLNALFDAITDRSEFMREAEDGLVVLREDLYAQYLAKIFNIDILMIGKIEVLLCEEACQKNLQKLFYKNLQAYFQIESCCIFQRSYLDLTFYQLYEIPLRVRKMVWLQNLSLWGNMFSRFPKELLTCLPQLKDLSLLGCPIREDFDEITPWVLEVWKTNKSLEISMTLYRWKY